MSSKTITIILGSGEERRKRLSNEDGYRNVLSEFGVACLRGADGVEIEDFQTLEDGAEYVLGAPRQGSQLKDTEVFTEEYAENVWRSVLRITSDVEGDAATALVFDVFPDHEESFLYLLLNEHYQLEDENTYYLQYCDSDNVFVEVDNFDRKDFVIFAESKENDFVIYKLPLSNDVWDIGPGIATRKPVENSKRPRRGQQQPARVPKASVICKTPSFWYEGIHPADEVRVYALPEAIPGRWVSQTRVTHVGKLVFYVQALSAPAGSGGAVLATKTGKVVGFMGGAYDVWEANSVDKKMVERRFNSFAFSVSALPDRPSSPPTSPTRAPVVPVARK